MKELFKENMFFHTGRNRVGYGDDFGYVVLAVGNADSRHPENSPKYFYQKVGRWGKTKIFSQEFSKSWEQPARPPRNGQELQSYTI